jgi:cell volume regulation protein A
VAEAALLGAVVGSTDAAAVFSTLRLTRLKRRLAGVLEAESGLNDPMAVALTVGLIAVITQPDYGAPQVAVELVRQLGLGLAVGLGLGMVAALGFHRLPELAAPFTPVASLAVAAVAYGAADAAGGSGFLAVYLVALRLGNTPGAVSRELAAFHQGLAFIAELVLFGVLGLLVFPHELGPVVLPGLALAAVLVLAARPLAVWLCTVRLGFERRERALLGWAGLRGAVPIVLATFALSKGLGASDTIFNAVVFVVLVSALIQGPTLVPLARRLGLAGEARPLLTPPVQVGALSGTDLLEMTLDDGDAAVGRRVRELGLPREALVAVIRRGAEALPPRGSTEVRAGDRLHVICRQGRRADVEALLVLWRDGPLPTPLRLARRAGGAEGG